jgi:hypothetical protein
MLIPLEACTQLITKGNVLVLINQLALKYSELPIAHLEVSLKLSIEMVVYGCLSIFIKAFLSLKNSIIVDASHFSTFGAFKRVPNRIKQRQAILLFKLFSHRINYCIQPALFVFDFFKSNSPSSPIIMQ